MSKQITKSLILTLTGLTILTSSFILPVKAENVQKNLQIQSQESTKTFPNYREILIVFLVLGAVSFTNIKILTFLSRNA
ncbi:MAG: hypothetical protein QNJ54_02060 [Prochloraceae cyanobacterium]|nr:hypothetical protein [Prochloraceae cyanobacterium]